MPYETVKIIKKLSNKPDFGFGLEDEKIWRRFHLYEGDLSTLFMWGTVAEFLEKNGQVKTVVFRDYKFKVNPIQYYNSDGSTTEYRTLYFPQDLINSYPVSEGMPIHLFLNTIDRDFGITNIFDENVRGVIEVEPRNEKGEILISSDHLVTTKFKDNYYSDLTHEINLAFYYKLPNATLVLLRKFFENLLVDLLQENFGEDELELYYDVNDNRHHNLGVLTKNLRQNFGELKKYDEAFYKDKENLTRFLTSDIKQHGDACAHIFQPFQKNMDKIKTLKPSINKYSAQIISIIEKIKRMKT